MRYLAKKGFTLIELVVSVAILLIAVGVTGDLIISVIRSYNKTRILNEIEQNGNYVIAKLTYDLKSAKAMIYDSSNKKITLTDQKNKTVVYDIKSVTGTGGSSPGQVGAVTRTYDVAPSEPMTNNDLIEGVSVNLVSSHFTEISKNPETVGIYLVLDNGPDNLNNGSKSLRASVTFDTTVVVSGVN